MMMMSSSMFVRDQSYLMPCTVAELIIGGTHIFCNIVRGMEFFAIVSLGSKYIGDYYCIVITFSSIFAIRCTSHIVCFLQIPAFTIGLNVVQTLQNEASVLFTWYVSYRTPI